MEVTPGSATLSPAPGCIMANPQARFVGPQKPQGATPARPSLQEGKKGSLGKGIGKILGKKLLYPSKLLKGKITSKLKGSLARKVQQLKNKKKGKR